jgi:hypothetical protein
MRAAGLAAGDGAAVAEVLASQLPTSGQADETDAPAQRRQRG